MVVILFGVVAAVAVNGRNHNNQTAGSTTSPTPSVDVSPTPAESPSASPSAAASPSASPTETPSAVPTTTPEPTSTPTAAPTGGGSGGTSTGSNCSTAGSGGAGPAGYPQQVSAGAQYQYCGPSALVVHATDSREAGGSSVCAGVNENTQAFPNGYEGVFFVGVQFPDGQIVSAGYIRTAAGREDFGSIQNASGSQKAGTLGTDPGGGSHTYCVTRIGANWNMTRDSTSIYTTTAEPWANLSHTVIKFDSDVQTVGRPAAANFTLTVPGFHDIAVDGAPPRELRGAAFYS